MYKRQEHSEFRDIEGTDVKDMRLEAEAVVNDVLFAVGNMFVSKSLPCAEDVAYINVETRERNKYCLELTEAGLRVNVPFVKFFFLSFFAIRHLLIYGAIKTAYFKVFLKLFQMLPSVFLYIRRK